jgi:hypothetical protein
MKENLLLRFFCTLDDGFPFNLQDGPEGLFCWYNPGATIVGQDNMREPTIDQCLASKRLFAVPCASQIGLAVEPFDFSLLSEVGKVIGGIDTRR